MAKALTSDSDKIREELAFQFRNGHAHASFDEVTENLGFELQGKVPKGLPYSAWQLLEHIRIAQEDMVNFSDNAKGDYVQPEWPDAYWPKSPAPPTNRAWNKSAQQVRDDRERFLNLIAKRDLFEPFAWGDGQTLFHEACLILDHTGYHLGEIITIRRLLGAWPAKK